MVYIELVIGLGLLGAIMGSFAGAVAWRLHTKRTFINDRSECEACHHKLAWFDLVPIFSWLLLGGRCRYCKKPIGWISLVTEVLLAATFVVSYLYWPFGFSLWQAQALFVIWLVYLILLAILLVYDARWMLLPDKLVFPLIAIGIIDAGLRVSLVPGAGIIELANHIVLGAGLLAGLYGALYILSGGRWVGFGDVKLSLFIGTVLGWQGALLTLGLANVIGFLVVLPGLATGKLTRTSRVPFGPFLIGGFVVSGIFGAQLIAWYRSVIGL